MILGHGSSVHDRTNQCCRVSQFLTFYSVKVDVLSFALITIGHVSVRDVGRRDVGASHRVRFIHGGERMEETVCRVGVLVAPIRGCRPL